MQVEEGKLYSQSTNPRPEC